MKKFLAIITLLLICSQAYAGHRRYFRDIRDLFGVLSPAQVPEGLIWTGPGVIASSNTTILGTTNTWTANQNFSSTTAFDIIGGTAVLSGYLAVGTTFYASTGAMRGSLTVGNTNFPALAWAYIGEGPVIGVSNKSSLRLLQAKGTPNESTLYMDNGTNIGVIQYTANAMKFYITGPSFSQKLQIDDSTPQIEAMGDLNITGALSKGSGTFKIPHPLDEKKWLYHGFVESNKYGVVYDGESQLSGGVKVITMPSWFEAVVSTTGRTIQLTCLDGFSGLYLDGKIENGEFTVRGTGSQKFFWQVSGQRGDPYIKSPNNHYKDSQGFLAVEVPIVPEASEILDEEKAGASTAKDKSDNAIKRKRAQYYGFESESQDLPELKR